MSRVTTWPAAFRGRASADSEGIVPPGPLAEAPVSTPQIDFPRLASSLLRLGGPNETLAGVTARGAFPAAMVGGALHVPLATGGTARYANLDYASSAPCLAVVRDAIDQLLPWYGSVHRGAGFVSNVMNEAYSAARDVVHTFVGARDDDTVIFTRNTTDALSLLASAVPDGAKVFTFTAEHHANLLPWRARAHHVDLGVPRTRDDALARAEEALRRARGADRVLSVTGASNVTGELWPIAELAEIAHRYGARIVVDAAQLAPHVPIDMARTNLDYVALSGHKMYAPFGAGALIGRGDWLDRADPHLAGGGAVKRVGADSVEWLTGPSRHEGGTPNVVGAVALAAACTALGELGHEAASRYENALLDRLLSGLRMLGAEPLALWGPHTKRIGLVSFNLSGFDPGALAAALSAEFGIGVRAGAFCAHPLMDALAPKASQASAYGAVRASVGLGTRFEDVERLLTALETLREDGPACPYRLDAGRWVVEGDARVVPAMVSRSRRGVSPPEPSCR